MKALVVFFLLTLYGAENRQPIYTSDPVDSKILPNSFCALYQKYPEISFFCSGALVAPRKIITAAHCLKERMAPQKLYWSCKPHPKAPDDLTEVPRGSMRLSERWRNGSTEAESDVAIIDLPIDDPHGTPIPLATEAEFSTLSQGKCVIVGHGLFEDQQSGKLVAGSAKFISAEKAKHKWLDVKVGPKPFEERYGNAVFTDATITKTQVGDSGGAVICQNKELKWIQVAVTSQRIGDDREFVKSYFDGTIEKTSVVNVAAPVFRPAAQLLLVPAASSSPSEPKASPAK